MVRTAILGSKQPSMPRYKHSSTQRKREQREEREKANTNENSDPPLTGCIDLPPSPHLHGRPDIKPQNQDLQTECGAGNEDVWTHETGVEQANTGISAGHQSYAGWQPVPRESLPKEEKVWGLDGKLEVYRNRGEGAPPGDGGMSGGGLEGEADVDGGAIDIGIDFSDFF